MKNWTLLLRFATPSQTIDVAYYVQGIEIRDHDRVLDHLAAQHFNLRFDGTDDRVTIEEDQDGSALVKLHFSYAIKTDSGNQNFGIVISKEPIPGCSDELVLRFERQGERWVPRRGWPIYFNVTNDFKRKEFGVAPGHRLVFKGPDQEIAGKKVQIPFTVETDIACERFVIALSVGQVTEEKYRKDFLKQRRKGDLEKK